MPTGSGFKRRFSGLDGGRGGVSGSHATVGAAQVDVGGNEPGENEGFVVRVEFLAGRRSACDDHGGAGNAVDRIGVAEQLVDGVGLGLFEDVSTGRLLGQSQGGQGERQNRQDDQDEQRMFLHEFALLLVAVTELGTKCDHLPPFATRFALQKWGRWGMKRSPLNGIRVIHN